MQICILIIIEIISRRGAATRRIFQQRERCSKAMLIRIVAVEECDATMLKKEQMFET